MKTLYRITPILAAAALMSACDSDTSALETPNPDITRNSGIVSHSHFSILADDSQPPVFDLDAGTATDTEVSITVKVGDRKNVKLTDSHTVFFATEWGLIQPSCVTRDGVCSVTWETSFNSDPNNQPPADAIVTITAWTAGEEGFIDANSNGVFDDADTTFSDIEEPFVDSNNNGIYDSGEQIIDVVNGNDPTGVNGVHDIGDTFLNSPACTHSSLCSPTNSTIFVWTDTALLLTGPPDTGTGP